MWGGCVIKVVVLLYSGYIGLYSYFTLGVSRWVCLEWGIVMSAHEIFQKFIGPFKKNSKKISEKKEKVYKT